MPPYVLGGFIAVDNFKKNSRIRYRFLSHANQKCYEEIRVSRNFFWKFFEKNMLIMGNLSYLAVAV